MRMTGCCSTMDGGDTVDGGVCVFTFLLDGNDLVLFHGGHNSPP